MANKTATHCEKMWLVIRFEKIFSLTIEVVVDSHEGLTETAERRG